MKFESLPPYIEHAKVVDCSLYMILCSDDFIRREALRELLGCILPQEENRPAVKTFDGGKTEIGSVMEELLNVGLFSQVEAVHLENCDQIKKEGQKLLSAYFSRPSEGVRLLLTAPTLNRSTQLYKEGVKLGVVLDIPEEKPWQKEKSLVERISRTISIQGKKITPAAATYFVQSLGTETALVHQELEKLICFVGDQQVITEADISAICTKLPQESAWQLGDAIFELDLKGALRIGKGLLEDGVQVIELLRQIRSQLKTKTQICTLLAKGGGDREVSTLFPYMRGNILTRNRTLAQNYGLKRCLQGLIEVDKTELLVKSSGAVPEVLAELLILKLAKESSKNKMK